MIGVWRSWRESPPWGSGEPIPLWPFAAGAAALAVGGLVTLGIVGLVVAIIAIGLTWFAVLGRRIVAVFLGAEVCLLAAYAFLDRGIAHVGVGPVYIGEAVLTLGVLAMLVSIRRLRLGWVELLLLLFMAWGAARTIPYIGLDGINALRDAVTWGYAVFALAIAATVGPAQVQAAVRLYRRLAFPLVLWLPISLVLTSGFSSHIPAVPGSDVPVIDYKAGDAAVQLAGIAAFILLGLYRWGRARAALHELRVWLFWIAAVAVSSILSRGGMLALAMASTSLLFVRSLSRLATIAIICVTLLVGGLLTNPDINVGPYRQVSFTQLVQNVTSIFSNQVGTATQATKEWRLAWWDTIIGYTIDGPYFWTGKGYGINLANSDGFQVTSDNSLRAPHSTHFEILARSGVPGLVLWVLLQAAFGVSLLVAAVRAWRRRAPFLVALIGWVFVYWAAAMVDASFDVYLGGPQGGIWFWSMFGLGLVLGRLAATGADVEEAPAATLEQVLPSGGRRVDTAPAAARR